MNGPDKADDASPPEPESRTSATPPTGAARSHPRRRRWWRAALLAFAGAAAILAVAIAWIALNPGLIHPLAEHVATVAAGRPVVIGEFDFRLLEGRLVIEATDVQVGRTTTGRVSISLSGTRSQVHGEDVRFPNGSSLERFRATLEVSPIGVPKISTVDASGATLVARRRGANDSSGPPPFARLLVVPRILLGLGLERLVVHSGRLEYHGRSSIHTAGLTAVLAAAGEDISIGGELFVAPEMPAVPFEGTVRDPMGEDWEVDVRLTGDRMPMDGVRLLAGVLEPGPFLRSTLVQFSNDSRFLLAVRLAQARIETIGLDFTFEDPRPSDIGTVSLEGVRFVLRAVPDPAGWTVEGEVDWTGFPEGEDTEPTPFTLRWATGVAGSLRWSARRVSVPLLAGLAIRRLEPDHPLGPALRRLRPAGKIEELAASGDPAAGDGAAPFWLSAELSGLEATAGGWRITATGARLDFAEGMWRVRFVNDRLRAAVPTLRSEPWELAVRGEIRIAPAEEGWAARAAGLEIDLAGVATRVDGSLVASGPLDTRDVTLDAEVRLDEASLPAVADLLPDLRGARFADWYRRAVRSGRLTDATLRIRGDPRGVPYANGDGAFEVSGTVHDVEFAYAKGWPAVQVDEAKVRANGAALEFADIRGSLFDTAFERGAARLADVTELAGRVRVEAFGRGPAGDLLEFLRTSPLGAADHGAAPLARADGPASIAVELDVPYGRDAASRRFGVAGTIELDGVAFSLADRPAVLEAVRGTLAFDAASLSGGPLPGHFNGEAIETHVAFERGEGLHLHFAGDGDGDWFKVALRDLANLDEAESGPWLDRITGRTAWDADYRTVGGIAFRTDLRTAAMDYPPPFEKQAGEARQFYALLVPGETEWFVEAGYGPDARAVFEIANRDDAWSLARGALALGGAQPTLPDEDHVEVTGRLSNFDLGPWLALGAPGKNREEGWLARIGRLDVETDAVRVFDRPVGLEHVEMTRARDGTEFAIRLAGEGVAGEIRFPADPAAGRALIRLDRLHFGALPDDKGDADEESADDPDGEETPVAVPDRWPEFDVHIESFRFAGLNLGVARATGRRTGSGLELEELRSDAPALKMRGRGSWLPGDDGVPVSRIEVRVTTEDLARVLSEARVASDEAASGAVDLHLDLAWPGSPVEPSFARIEGEIGLSARDGHLPRVRVGPFGRLLALLSLDALPRVLALDLSHVVGKGLAFDRIRVRTRVADGLAGIQEFSISGPSAVIEGKGNVDLVARQYDQEIAVIPRVTRSGVLLPVWATVWPVLIGNFVLEKVSGKDTLLDRLFRIKYRLQGPWDDPVIERMPLVPVAGQEQ